MKKTSGTPAHDSIEKLGDANTPPDLAPEKLPDFDTDTATGPTRDAPSATTDAAGTGESWTRRAFLAGAVLAAPGALAVSKGRMPAAADEDVARRGGGIAGADAPWDDRRLTVDDIAAAERLSGLSFTDSDRELMLEDVQERLAEYETLREFRLSNPDPPALVFNPTLGGADRRYPDGNLTWKPTPSGVPSAEPEDLAFAGVAELAALLRDGTVTSTRLTELALSRLQKYDPVLHAVITLTAERALEQAAAADREISDGRLRSPLHGIPYGAKDLISAKGYPTTWGAEPYRNQVIDEDAHVIRRLEEAGAVLTAKLSLGALAWGDVWFGEQTRNPWNIEEGSSGSSAGPGSAVSAGLLPFAVGSETYGSIVSPSTRNGITGFRPSFGLVGRTGAMVLSWTMDKLGPMCRSALDCALVFDTIRGRDTGDPASVDVPFPFDPGHDPQTLRVGFYESAFAEAEGYDNRHADLDTLDVIRSRLGIDLAPVQLPAELPIDEMVMILNVEAAAAFDELTRARGTDSMVRQERRAWPNVFRHSRLIPAVEYVQANRLRVDLARRMAEVFEKFDVIVCPSFQGKSLAMTNLSGHPAVCVPNSFRPVEGHSERRSPGSITFLADLYRDADALLLAHAYQSVTDFHLRRPPVS